MTADAKEKLSHYLASAHAALRWKLEGLSEYDLRRPLVPTGSNLLGILKHVASVEAGYLGDVFGRAFPDPLPWFAEGAASNADMWVTVDEASDDIFRLADRSRDHARATIEALDLDAIGQVPWWGPDNEVTLHHIMVHLIAEVNRHGGHADIIRELIDGQAGLRADNANLPPEDADWWVAHHDRVEAAARQFRPTSE